MPHQEKDTHEYQMKQIKMIVRTKLVVGYWDFIPMISGAVFLSPLDTATVRVAKERLEAKKQRNSWWTEENWPRLKKYLVNSWYPSVRGKCDESCLQLGLDPVPKQTVFNVLQSIGRKPITY